ncbi:aminopeptidase P family protein [Martelella lutilitoris]|uniref:Aminopeptidase P family protein n=1 Tax=Martelella lutilitoris TaxID=2583532 RepID=A0A5C4JL00_9HYPH|nr:Xaa-Pro peptidase family protein [Martelella lutilitoris]TNB46185.1 aminopeptidase P family protein [Martelella lutilitoris]
MTNRPEPISKDERKGRIERLRAAMQTAGAEAVLLGSTTSLAYFTGLVWHQSERLVGALVTADSLTYIAPAFEVSKIETLERLDGDIAAWDEHEDPAALTAKLLGQGKTLALDDALPFAIYSALARQIAPERLTDGGPMISGLRAVKSPAEIALMQYAMDATLEVHKRVHAMIEPGIRASDVVRFIDETHRALCGSGSTFAICSFGAATSLPHGVDDDQTYAEGDIILVDTGTIVGGYQSDMTRTYVKAEPSAEFARIWGIEREAQQAVFDAAKPGVSAETLDHAARRVIAAHGLGPDYRLPGLPHRAGHGLGMDIHEAPFIVRGNATPLQPGMCFSNEPMIVVPEKFGVRLEDIIHMGENGPIWFTTPGNGPTEPFA